jgi:hypothetical protein
MRKCINELNRNFSKEEVQMAKNAHEEIFNILVHKGNVNQNHIKISSPSYHNGYYQKHNQ